MITTDEIHSITEHLDAIVAILTAKEATYGQMTCQALREHDANLLRKLEQVARGTMTAYQGVLGLQEKKPTELVRQRHHAELAALRFAAEATVAENDFTFYANAEELLKELEANDKR